MENSTNEELLYDFCIWLEDLRGYSMSTLDKYERYVKRLIKHYNNKHITEITLKEIEDYIKSLTVCTKTINLNVASIRKFLQYCYYHDIKVVDYKKLFYVKEIPNTPIFCEVEEIKSLINKAKREPDKKTALRNEIIVRSLFHTGLRISELLKITIDKIKADLSITILGKGNVERIVYINKEIKVLIDKYLKYRVDSQKALFISHSKNSYGKKLSRNSAGEIIRRYRKELHIVKKITPHSLRHSTATLLLRSGENLKSIQTLLGHKNITTTQNYLHITNHEIKKTQSRLDVI